MKWSAVSRLLVQVVQFLTTAVLARLITPAEFGLVALVMVFASFAALFSDLGLGAAVIHRGDCDDTFLSTAFWINALSGVAITGLLIGVSPLIAAFFDQPGLTRLLVVASLTYTVSLSVVHSAMLQKRLAFKLVGLVEFVAALVFTGLTIWLATLGLGSMALVLGTLAQAAITTVVFWALVRWRPHSFISRRAAREIWGYSAGLIGYNAVNYWTRNLDNLLIGRFTSPSSLAFYARAYNVMLLPIGQLNIVVGRVMFPAMSAVRGDLQRLKLAYLRALRVLIAIGYPICVVLATGATPFVAVVYGPQWTAVAPLLAVLALSAPPQFIGITTGPLYQALGLNGKMFRRSLWSAAATAIAVVIGLHWGALGVAVALAVKAYVILPVTASGVWRGLELSVVGVLRTLDRCTLAALCAAAVSIALRWLFGATAPVLALLAVQTGAIVATFAFALWAFDRELLRELLRLAPGKRLHARPRHRAAG